MTRSVIGFAGMTHLGLVSAVAAAEKGFDVVCFDPNPSLIEGLIQGEIPIQEPGLNGLHAGNQDRLRFTLDLGDLTDCGVVLISFDVPTDDQGDSDLLTIQNLIDAVSAHVNHSGALVILSQVPPGFTRSLEFPRERLFYQVETLIFGEAVDRALNPERFIVGCADPGAALPGPYKKFLDAFGCPVLPMRYESAELAKIAINCFLVAQISTTNTLAELCEAIDADWAEIAPALKLDKRIGADAYLKPGLGIAGGNLERDLATVKRLAAAENTDAGVVESWVANSEHRKLAAAELLKSHVLNGNPDPLIAVWGLAYKENTHSTKNSPSLATLAALPDCRFRVHDPVVPAEAAGHPGATGADSPLAAAKGADVLMILTPWQDYKDIDPAAIADAMAGKVVIDPYRVLDGKAATAAGLDYHTLGAPHATP